jgi:peptidyl-prolyl cis-trans isomerase C
MKLAKALSGGGLLIVGLVSGWGLASLPNGDEKDVSPEERSTEVIQVPNTDELLAIVGNRAIDRRSFELSGEQTLAEIVYQEAIAQFAESSNMFSLEEIDAMTSNYRRNLIADMAVAEILKQEQVTREEVSSFLDLMKDGQMGQKYQIKVARLQYEDQANKLIQDLMPGEGILHDRALEQMKALRDLDGNEVQWLGPESMPQMVRHAIANLSPGEVTETPIATQQGWWVIYLVESKPRDDLESDVLLAKIEESIKRSKARESIQRIVSSAEIEIL